MAQPKETSAYPKTLIKDTGTSYTKKCVLGKGTFGIVFRGCHQDREVAVKRLELERLDQEDREVKLQTKLEHENVLKILAVEDDDDYRYIVLELCAGTLGQVIDKTYNGPELPIDIDVLYQIANGLDYIHSQKLIHRDVKPENILISMEGKIKLADFGLRKQVTEEKCYITGPKGPLLWMAPECFPSKRNETNTKRTKESDVFSCGCVFSVFLTRENGGIHPFGDTIDHLQIYANIQEGKPTNIHKINYNHISMVNLIKKMIQHDPIKRITSMEVKNEIRDPLGLPKHFLMGLGTFRTPTSLKRYNISQIAPSDSSINRKRFPTLTQLRNKQKHHVGKPRERGKSVRNLNGFGSQQRANSSSPHHSSDSSNNVFQKMGEELLVKKGYEETIHFI